MSIRLQVVMDEKEAREFRRRARAEGVTLSEWVRQALRRAAARRHGPTHEQRMEAVQRAAQCGHPTVDIDEVLGDIERGRGLR